EVQVDRLRVDLDHLDERLDRLVRLLVEQEVETAEVRQRQRARFAQEMLDVDARGNPAEREKQDRERQQPPELVFHGARWRRLQPPSTGCRGWEAGARRCSLRRRESCRLSRVERSKPARSPATTPVANASSSRMISGACQ